MKELMEKFYAIEEAYLLRDSTWDDQATIEILLGKHLLVILGLFSLEFIQFPLLKNSPNILLGDGR